MIFSMNSALPENYRSGAFVGEHGSWNRNSFNGYEVVYIPFENGMPSAKAQSVVTGFLEGDQARGRPVGVGIDGTGALLVADDAGNTVWRVAASDGSVTPEPLGTDQMVTGAATGLNERGSAALPDTGSVGSDPSDTQQDEAAGSQPSITTTGEAAAAYSSGNQPAEQEPSASSSGTVVAAPPPQTDIAPAVQPEGTVQDAPAASAQ
jgi:hypothetical protein